MPVGFQDRPSCCLAAPYEDENRYPPHPDPLPRRGEGKKLYHSFSLYLKREE